eukprot:TRINITY_DN15406_c0_g1_i1.p1 TRINITY_DN15406_c0_g1~~TRINITY_DN15406_c0_g1_i1.p1  ORF type:complete len:794 (-),score=190.52 TRINITY_DN15406_c0_g1_i1:2223-4604(-)
MIPASTYGYGAYPAVPMSSYSSYPTAAVGTPSAAGSTRIAPLSARGGTSIAGSTPLTGSIRGGIVGYGLPQTVSSVPATPVYSRQPSGQPQRVGLQAFPPQVQLQGPFNMQPGMQMGGFPSTAPSTARRRKRTMSGKQGATAWPSADEFKQQAMELFQIFAVDDKLSERQFISLVRMGATRFLRRQVESGSSPESVRPALLRAIERFDVSGAGSLMKEVFAALDKDKNGYVDKEEYERLQDILYKAVNDSSTEKKFDPVHFAFQVFDKNKNGKISLDEMQTLMDALLKFVACLATQVIETVEYTLTAKEIQDMIAENPGKFPMFMQMDTNGDGMISRQEWNTFISNMSEKDMAPFRVFVMGLDNFGNADAGIVGALEAAKPMVGTALSEMRQVNQGMLNRIVSMVVEAAEGGMDEQQFMAKAVPEVKAEIHVDFSFQKIEEFLRSSGGPVLPLLLNLQPKEEMDATPSRRSKSSWRKNRLICESDSMKSMIEDAQKKMEALVPELLHQLFLLMDIDGNGFITAHELQLCKSLSDLLAVATKDPSKSDLKPILLSLFDFLDKDGNGYLTMSEITQYMVKIIGFVSAVLKMAIDFVVEVLGGAVCRAGLPFLWRSAQLTEVAEEDVPKLLMMGGGVLLTAMVSMGRSDRPQGAPNGDFGANGSAQARPARATAPMTAGATYCAVPSAALSGSSRPLMPVTSFGQPVPLTSAPVLSPTAVPGVPMYSPQPAVRMRSPATQPVTTAVGLPSSAASLTSSGFRRTALPPNSPVRGNSPAPPPPRSSEVALLSLYSTRV